MSASAMVYSDEAKCPNSYEVAAVENSESDTPWKFWKKRRYVVAFLAFFGFFNAYSLRVNLSIGIVAMTELKNITLENGTVIESRHFDWDHKLQGYILSSFFYGYITTQIIGGYLGTRMGGKRIFGLGIAMTSVFTIATPFILEWNVYVFIAVRIIEGVFEGVTYPCMHVIWSKWAPPFERSRLATIAFSGSYVGTVVSMPLCSYLAAVCGWESIFYCFGTVGFIWCLIWMVAITDSPEEDSRISDSELRYIQESLKHVRSPKSRKLPWGSILVSLPVWAITVSHFSENWGFYTLLTQLPTFMKNVLKFDLKNAGFMSALPYLAMAIMIQFSGQFADWLLVKGILTTTHVRKMFNCGAFVAQTVFMLGAAYWLSPVGTTLCLTMAVGLGAFAWSGFSVNHLDIAPQYAGVLMGFGNTFATIPGILSPIITGYLVKDETSVEEWRIVFYISAGIYGVGCIFYGVFASGKLQPWAIVEREHPKDIFDISNESDIRSGYDNKNFHPDD